MIRTRAVLSVAALLCTLSAVGRAADDAKDVEFFEKRIRPFLVKHCYECHSEAANEQQGGLLLDRSSGWLDGGDTGKAIVPGDPDASLLVKAVRYTDEDLQMPPDGPLEPREVGLFEQWIRRGALGPAADLGDTEFSRLGDQDQLFARAQSHWAFQPVAVLPPPPAGDPIWNRSPIDRFVFSQMRTKDLTPSGVADPRTLARRLSFDLTGLPPTPEQIRKFRRASRRDQRTAVTELVDHLLSSPAYGEQIGRMWLDVARYADTDSFYRPDTRTPHYFPFAFTYRDYVVDAFNRDKPYDRFIREQLTADLMGLSDGAVELAALGFLTVGPHVNRNPTESIDDWVDVTTRGLMGLTAACARCHDHKFEPIPTADYYSLHGIFASLDRPHPLDQEHLPVMPGYETDQQTLADYEQKRAAVEAKIQEVGSSTTGGNKLSLAQRIRDTELAELLLFHPGAPAHTMVVKERANVTDSYVFLRGDPTNRGENVPRRFLKILDDQQQAFPSDSSGRVQLVDKIVAPDNPLTARVFVNRVWGLLIGSYLVDTPSDFGLQGSEPTHPQLLDWLAADFVANGWSVKRLVRMIVLSRTYQQESTQRVDMVAIDPQNRQLWRANRKHLAVESIRDSLLAVSEQLDRTARGRPAQLWGDQYTRRRAIYGYINRFNLDPTLRVFDFPNPMQTQSNRGESIVAPQALFTMNSPFVIDQAIAVTESVRFDMCDDDAERVATLFQMVLQRDPTPGESSRTARFVEAQQKYFSQPSKASRMKSPWPLVAQSLMMSNEFQYVD